MEVSQGCFQSFVQALSHRTFTGYNGSPTAKTVIAFKHLLSFYGTTFLSCCYMVLLGCLNWPMMLNYSSFMRLIYGRFRKKYTPKDKDIGDAQVSASQQGMRFMCESVLVFHRI